MLHYFAPAQRRPFRHVLWVVHRFAPRSRRPPDFNVTPRSGRVNRGGNLCLVFGPKSAEQRVFLESESCQSRTVEGAVG